MADNNYVVGKGRIYFDRFTPGTRIGTGFRYFGNTPSLEVTRAATALDHFSAEGGVKVKDDSIDIETTVGGKFACDNISSPNLALWFGGVVNPITQTVSAQAITETPTLGPDLFYKMGRTSANPQGVNGVTNYTVSQNGGPAYVEGTDYVVNAATGILHILPTGSIPAGTQVLVSYKTAAGAYDVVVESGDSVYGALMFVSDNPKGSQRDYTYPYVKLSATGTFALKGDTWQQCEWNYEALQLNDATRRVYVASR